MMSGDLPDAPSEDHYEPDTRPLDYDNLEETLKPIGTWILAKLNKIENITPGGIYIPTPAGAAERSTFATVLAKGKGTRTSEGNYIPIEVEIGDVIYYGVHSGIDVTDQLIIIKEEQIIGILK